MVQDLHTALLRVLSRLENYAQDDGELRYYLRVLGRTLIAFAEEDTFRDSDYDPREDIDLETCSPPSQTQQSAIDEHAEENSADTVEITPTFAKARPQATVAKPQAAPPKPQPSHANFGRTLASPSPPATAIETSNRDFDIDLGLMARHFRLKVEGTVWAKARRKLAEEGGDYSLELEPQYHDLINRAKEMADCFLWMCHPDMPEPPNEILYDTLEGCFECAGRVTTLLHEMLQQSGLPRETLEQAMDLAGEAQSSLRQIVLDVGAKPDMDQLKMFNWLRHAATQFQHHIPRYMYSDDPANPMEWQDLLQRIQPVEELFQNYKNRDKRHQSLLKQIAYHWKRINNYPEEDHAHDWNKIHGAVDTMVSEGVPPSNRELREVLVPLAEAIPDEMDLPKNFVLALRETEKFLTNEDHARPTITEDTPTEDVRRAAELLRGREVVLIGGLKRPAAATALMETFDLKELIWIEGRDQTYVEFEPQVARPEVAIVVLAIRWSRHGFGEVKEFCDKYDKPLVRLPGGYSPNQVAYQVLSQVGDNLTDKYAAAAS